MKEYEKLAEEWAKNNNDGNDSMIRSLAFEAGFLKAREMCCQMIADSSYDKGLFSLFCHIKNLGEKEINDLSTS